MKTRGIIIQVLLLSAGLFLISSIVEADQGYLIPLPIGEYIVTNDVEGHNHYLSHPQESLDFQVANIPSDIETPVTQPRCFSYGTPILAARAGIISNTTNNPSRHKEEGRYGTSVTITHDDGSIAIYGHMIHDTNTPYVSIGDRVVAGQILGLMGDTGNIKSSFKNNPCLKDENYGTHLHFEVQKGHLQNLQSLKTNSIVTSDTPFIDPSNTYETLHAGNYPFVLRTPEPPINLPPKTGPTEITDLRYIIPKAGEKLSVTIMGENLDPSLDIQVLSPEPICKTKLKLSNRQEAILTCQLPLNLGPVAQENEQTFSIVIKEEERLIHQEDFFVNYGISAAQIKPQKAVYYTPTRFTITGKNVHRTTVFYIEGCRDEDIKIIDQQYDRLVLDCWIMPPPNTDISIIDGKSFQHLYLFKTESRFDEDGNNLLTDEEDDQNVVLSGFITVAHDFETRLDSITPKTALIDQATRFTVHGNNLPYSETHHPRLFIDHCEKLTILPESYTPYGFEAECTPRLDNSEPNPAFDLNQFDCELIRIKNLNERQSYQALEKCAKELPSDRREELWNAYDRFIKQLAPRQVWVTDTPYSDSITLSSETHQFINHEEKFLQQFPRHDELYEMTGPAQVDQLITHSIDRQNRQQTITILGSSLPYETELLSNDCAQSAITYGSSERFSIICLLKKSSRQELQIIDQKQQDNLYRKTIDIREVYEAKVYQEGIRTLSITLKGVNLDHQSELTITSCDTPQLIGFHSTSELHYLCQLNGGLFSAPEKIQVSFREADNNLLFDQQVPILEPLPELVNITTQKQPPVEISSQDPLVIDMGIVTLSCSKKSEGTLHIGTCDLSSPFLRSGNVLTAIDLAKKQFLTSGSFNATLNKDFDQKTSQWHGIKINPASGKGTIAADGIEKQLIFSGEISGIGFSLEELFGYPFSFDLVDYAGELILGIPSFDRQKSREDSHIVFAIGQIDHPSLRVLQDFRDGIESFVQNQLKTLNTKVHSKKLEIGAKLTQNIQNPDLKRAARKTYLKLFKELQIVPETLAFYDNYDLVGRGVLRSEPFRPTNWGDNMNWIASADLASLDFDLSAHKGEMKVSGSVLNSLSLFNNDIISSEKGILNTELMIGFSEEEYGSLHLDNLSLTLPGGLAHTETNLHVSNLLNSDKLWMSGKILAAIEPFGIKVARGGAFWRFDPNGQYRFGDQVSKGLFQLESQLHLIALMISGKGVIGWGGDSDTTVIDIGGNLEIDFLDYQQPLAEAIGRARFKDKVASFCMNAETGQIDFDLPVSWGKFSLQGGLSMAGTIDTNRNFLRKIDEVIMSGQTTPNNRMGFRYNPNNNLFSIFTRHDKRCNDVPDETYLDTILAQMPDTLNTNIVQKNLIASSDPSPLIIAQALAEQNKPAPVLDLSALWDMNGWIGIKHKNPQEQALIIRGPDGEIEDLNNTEAPGLWYTPAPDRFLFADYQAFVDAGYALEIKANTQGPITFVTAHYLDQEEIEQEFTITHPKAKHTLSLQNLSKGHINLGDEPSKADTNRERSLQDEDLRVNAKVSNIPQEDPHQPDPITSAKDLNQDLFPDVRSPILREAIIFLTQRGIIDGYEDNSFRPNQSINRAEALKLIFAARGISTNHPIPDPPFPDVSRTDWFAAAVMAAREKGIIHGYPDGSFRPAQTVNKAEFIKMSMSAQDFYLTPIDPQAASRQYRDLDSDAWYMPYVSFGILNGFLEKSTQLSPTESMSRGEAALILYRILKYQEFLTLHYPPLT